MEVARIVCSQCGRTIRDFGLEGGLVSHGLCVECGAEFARRIEALEPEAPSPLARATLAAFAAAP